MLKFLDNCQEESIFQLVFLVYKLFNMTIEQSLKQFYIDNGLPENGGEDKDFFELEVKPFTLKLPNPEFRKKVIHIHDIEHVLYNCDISWKGESFIAGWEIATGFWKVLPIGILSLSTMGIGLFLYPKEVLKGFKNGINTTGIIDLKLSREELLKFETSALRNYIKKEETKKVNWFSFLFWCFISEFVLLFPLFILIGFIIWIF